MSKLSLRLRELRESKSLSQQKFADYIGISKSSINMYERGEREPGIETLENIADFFNVDLDYLIGKSDIPNKLLSVNSNIDFKSMSLFSKFNSLNSIGKQKAETYIDDLLENPKYTIEKINKPTTSVRDRFEIAAYGGEGNRSPKKKRETT